MQLIDPNHSFYRPLWVRLCIVAFCAGWTVVEIVAWQPFWAVIAGGIAVYSAYMLLLNFKPQPAEAPATGDSARNDDGGGE